MTFTLSPRTLRVPLACMLAICACAPGAWASNEAAAAKATPSSAAPNGPTYKPKSGETLDQVIAKTMGASPLSLAILRQAFIDQNPQAIVAGKVPKLRKGVTLVVPDHDLLLRGVLASVAPVAAPSDVVPRPAPSTPDERKRWVHFP